MNHTINRRLLEDQSLWHEINQQTTLFLDLFTEISNTYTQQELVKIFPSSKGCKVTKGLQLLGCPYQVLDIVRDFDEESGFNIRILNWWGHGLFLIILAGKQRNQQLALFGESNPCDYTIFTGLNPWDYEQLILSKPRTTLPKDKFSSEKRLQIFKKIALPDDVDLLRTALSKEIDRIMEYTW
ncbi:hypothetical protein [Mongoliitalea lutea]|uniref:Uncharacterized protein n=1 Tax=Mongoliitalea lutea TaxID=849756 RepID=A0A8J3CVJ1_9BACT|nr:hypothetical protein [Mongoliitalea lutea]GHB31571.1 hypothetical protein GCM10008106_10540 [Mongoliitalea lutea]